MKNILKLSVAALALSFSVSSCIQEINPQSSTVTKDQAANAPGAFNNFVSSITNSLCGKNLYGSKVSSYPWDYGMPTFFLQRDVMGNDIAIGGGNNWYVTWYSCGTGLGPGYAYCQAPWTIYYSWIKNCNNVISLAGEEPEDEFKTGAGIAYAMRAMFYMDLARMFAQETYGDNPQAPTVPITTEKTTGEEAQHNPRATNEEMWKFIIEDLNKAEEYLAGYKRENVYTPDLSVVYGLKARAYLVMEDWANAKTYAKNAYSMNDYKIMSAEQYTSRNDGFNTPNSAWMFGVTFQTSDPCMTDNDADSSWGSWMILEVTGSECGYAADYGGPMYIDRHLYESMPDTDCRKKCFIDFAIDEETEFGSDEMIEELSKYSDVPEGLLITADAADGYVGGLSLKFRPKGGEHNNQYIGFNVAVPMMRVEEMYLIEAEAAGMLNESDGVNLLKAFAAHRDPAYVYGNHTDQYKVGDPLTTFQLECWWQRRAEFWGEGMATFDIKRLNRGIIRSYPGTNHCEGYRWNLLDGHPVWMDLCIVQTETNYNQDCVNNPTPLKPSADSDEYKW